MAATVMPANLSQAAVASYAEKVADHYDVKDSDGRVDLDRLVETLGGSVRVAWSGESLHVQQPGTFTIFVPQHTSKRRDRFTIAHELGHYFLHYVFPELTEEQSFSRGESNRVETQANVFAASLLMPAQDFTSAWRELGADTWEIARRFEVSPRAVEVRAQVLNLT